MVLITFPFIIYITLTLSKFFFAGIAKSENIKGKSAFEFNNTFFLIPFYTSFLKFRKNLELNIFDKKLILSEVMSLASTLIFILSLINQFLNKDIPFEDLIINVFFFFILLVFFLYLAIFDLLTFSIPVPTVKLMYLFVILMNFSIGLSRYIFFRSTGEVFFKHVLLGNMGNLAMGLILGLFIWILIKFTKNEGFGEGDIDVMSIIGFSFGWPFALSALFFIIVGGGLIAGFYSLIIGKVKGVIIPFVPLILIGFCIAVGFSDDFTEFLINPSLIY